MLHIKFQAAQPSSSGEEDFFRIVYLRTQDHSDIGPFWIQRSSFEQIWYKATKQRYIPSFKHLSEPSGSEGDGI